MEKNKLNLFPKIESVKKLTENVGSVSSSLRNLNMFFDDLEDQQELADVFNNNYEMKEDVMDMATNFNKIEIAIRKKYAFRWKKTFSKANENEFENDCISDLLLNGTLLLVIECELNGIWYWLDKDCLFGTEYGNDSITNADPMKVEEWIIEQLQYIY